jgi:hypothetical protein
VKLEDNFVKLAWQKLTTPNKGFARMAGRYLNFYN